MEKIFTALLFVSAAVPTHGGATTCATNSSDLFMTFAPGDCTLDPAVRNHICVCVLLSSLHHLSNSTNGDCN